MNALDALIDAELELRALTSAAKLTLLRRQRPGDRCTHCGLRVDVRESCVVNRAVGLIYHWSCRP